jgi:hypothetical protein
METRRSQAACSANSLHSTLSEADAFKKKDLINEYMIR